MSDKNRGDRRTEETSQGYPQAADQPSQGDQATLTPDKYKRVFARRRRVIWFTFAAYLFATVAAILLIKAGMGPIKSKTAMEDIESIRACTVRPLRDFFGWGLRIKADGSRGFIADINVGFEFIRKDGRRTVVSVRDPQRYVDYVRWVKTNKHNTAY
jgi:hypothetical protein